MADAANTAGEQAPKVKTGFFKGLKAEFKKIVWPDQETFTKQTVAVFVTSIVLGLVIALLDLVIKGGLNLIL